MMVAPGLEKPKQSEESLCISGSEYLDLIEFSEFRADIISTQVKRLSKSRSWQITAVVRKLNWWVKQIQYGLRSLLDRAPDHSEYQKLLNKARCLIAASGLFDEKFYREQLSGIRLANEDPLDHFILKGWKLGFNPNPFFNCNYYSAQAALAGLPVTVNPLLHYLLIGARELIPTSKFFDSSFYVANYSDVIKTNLTPLSHFLQFGLFENRHPVSLSCGLEAMRAVRTALSLDINETALPRLAEFVAAQFDLVLAIHAASRTGAPMLGLSLLKQFREQGLNVLVFLADGGELLPEFSAIASVICLQDTVSSKHASASLAVHLDRLLKCRRLNPDIPVILNSAENLFVSEVFTSRGFKPITLVHEFMQSYKEDQRNLLFRNSPLMIFSSDELRQACPDLESYKGQVRVLTQGLLDDSYLDFDRQSNKEFLRALLGIESNAFIVLGCGTIEPRKGTDIFVEVAISLLQRKLDQAVHFVWVGGEVKYAPDCKRWAEIDIKQAGVQNNVHFIDAQTDLKPFFTGADLFLLSSRQDPFPCVVQSAMACALPVVAFDKSGGVPTILKGGAGKVVSYGAVEEMVEAVLSFVEQPKEAECCGKIGKKLIAEKFKMSDYAKSVLQAAQSIACGWHRVDEVAEHYDSFNKLYEDSYGTVLQAYRPPDVDEMLEKQLLFSGMQDGMTVLDAGCGLCGPALYFAAKRKVQIKAVTVSAKQAQRARQIVQDRLPNQAEKVQVVCADFHSLNDDIGKGFDLIYYLESFSHSPDPSKAILEAKRVLKPGGAIFIKDYFLHDWSHDPKTETLVKDLAKLVEAQYKYKLTNLDSLKETLLACGFEIVKEKANSFASNEDPLAQLKFEELAGLDWREKAGGAVQVADSVMLLARLKEGV